jgi:hypothetical protein
MRLSRQSEQAPHPKGLNGQSEQPVWLSFARRDAPELMEQVLSQGRAFRLWSSWRLTHRRNSWPLREGESRWPSNGFIARSGLHLAQTKISEANVDIAKSF